MDKKEFKDVSDGIRTHYKSAMSAIEKKNYDYAILLLKGIVQKEPGFIVAREQLRKIERIKTGNTGVVKKLVASLLTSASVTSGKSLLARKKTLEAMKKAEDALAVSLASLPALNLLAQTAEAMGAQFIAIEALEIAREYFPKNLSVLDWLARAYAADGQGINALKVRQQISDLKPNDPEVQQALRAAAALATMEHGRWEDQETDYRGKLKSEEEAVKLEQQERIVRNVDDIQDMIKTYEKQRAEGDESIDLLRKLAELYQKAGSHDKALEYFNLVVQKMGVVDPYLDLAIEKSNVAKYDQAIEEWRQYAESDQQKKKEAESNIRDIEQQKYNYRLEKAVERVNNYPNDLQLRFDLALIYWEGNDVESALQQFQLSQKNPQRRLSSLVYMGRCFRAKGQYDIAIEELKKAIDGMVAMDKQKMEAFYNLGLTYEDTGEKEKAMDCFKKIYQVNVKFRDVTERMEKFYKKR